MGRKYSPDVNQGIFGDFDNGNYAAFEADGTLRQYSAGVMNGLSEKKNSQSVADDGTIVLPTGVSGILEVFEETEYLKCHIKTDGTVTLISGTVNTAGTDSDGNLCVYDSGSGATIKNRLAGTKTIRYFFNYS